MAGRRSSRGKAAAEDAPPADEPAVAADTPAAAEPLAAAVEEEADAPVADVAKGEEEEPAPPAEWAQALGDSADAWPAHLRPSPLLAVARVPGAISSAEVGEALKAAGLAVSRADSGREPREGDDGGAGGGGGEGEGGGEGGAKQPARPPRPRTVYVRLAPPSDPAADVYAAAEAAIATLPKAPSGGDRVVTVGTGTPHAAACTVTPASKAGGGGGGQNNGGGGGGGGSSTPSPSPLEVTLFVDNAPPAWLADAAAAAEAMAPHGPLVRAGAPVNAAGDAKGYIFLEFATPAAAGRAKAALDAADKAAREEAKKKAADGKEGGGGGGGGGREAAAAAPPPPRLPRGEWAFPSCAAAQWSRVLYVQNLPAALTPAGEASEEPPTLLAAVRGYGPVDTASAPRGKGGAARGFAFVEFKHSASADAAYRAVAAAADGSGPETPLGPGVRASFSNPAKSRDAPLGGGKRPGDKADKARGGGGGGDRKRGRDRDRGDRDRGDRRDYRDRGDRRGPPPRWRDDRDRGRWGDRGDRGGWRDDDRRGGGWGPPPPPYRDDRRGWGPPPPPPHRGGGGDWHGGYGGPPPPPQQGGWWGGGGGGGGGGGWPPQQPPQQQQWGGYPPQQQHDAYGDDPYAKRQRY